MNSNKSNKTSNYKTILTLWCQMTYKDITNSVSKFGGILFIPIQCFGKLQDPWISRFLCVARMDPSTSYKPAKAWFICRHIATAQYFQWVMLFDTQLASVHHLPCSSPWVETSTLAYETNTKHWPERLSVPYCTHTIQTKLILKNQKYPQKLMFTATGGTTDLPLLVLG